MAKSVQNKKRRIKFICKLTRYGLFIDIGRNASDMHINRLILANMNQMRKPGETGRLTPQEYRRRGTKPKATDIICCLTGFLALVLLAAFMILPRWIPRDDPEGVYNARCWLANCLCDDGRAFLVVTNHRTYQTVWSHPGEDFINTEGIWKNGPDDHSFVFEMENAAGETLTFQAECYWGGMKWRFETEGIQSGFFWFPRLKSGVYCDYYNKSFWLNGAIIAGIIMIVTGIINVLLNIQKTDKLLKQLKENRQNQ